MDTLKVAVVGWEIREVNSLQAFLSHASEHINEACSNNADLIVLPESIDLERISYHGEVPQNQVASVLATEFDEVRQFLEGLAREKNITLVAGTHLHQLKNHYYNSALICEPHRTYMQTKNILTQWEAEEWMIEEGRGLRMASSIPMGTLICYDSEFPGSARAICESGAKIIVVPAYTETQRGFNRVRWSCHARAVECQVFVVHASLVGTLNREPVSQTYGTSAILCPSVEPFEPSGILAETPLNQEGIAYASLDLNLIEVARSSDDVRNWHDRDKGTWEIIS